MEPEASAEQTAEPEQESPQEAAAPAEHDGLVSAATAALATGAMAEITRMSNAANHPDAGPPMGGGRTLEDVVREALIPELRVWLDANLPQLVERIVREEIRKMVRRAEQQ